jgi:two-component system sensor histidine kinase KdpD
MVAVKGGGTMGRKLQGPRSAYYYAAIVVLFTAAATGIGLLFRSIGFREVNIVIIYFLSVLLTARFTQGFVYGIIASLAATVTFNFFFTEPYFTLSVNDPSYFVTFTVMTITAIVTGALTSKEKQSAQEALEKESETSSLYRLTKQLTEVANIHDIASAAAGAISEVLGCLVAVLYFDETGKAESNFVWKSSDCTETLFQTQTGEAELPSNQIKQPQSIVGDRYIDWSIHGREALLGTLYIPKETVMSESQTRLIHSMIESTALAMDRLLSAQARIKSNEEAAQERYRGNLLRAISHDLRTPLAGIMGTAEMIKGMTEAGDPRHGLAEDIYKESDWLHTLVKNILGLTRLRDGALPLNRQMVPVEEVVGGAVNHVIRLSGREITVEAPDEVLFVPMDAGLIEQVLVNLLDNAVKHTPPWEEIKISVRRDDENRMAVITVSDSGSGILKDDLPNIFQMFYTASTRKADAARGAGLGLTICAAIVHSHGGSIEARNRPNGHGAEFEFSLPMEEKHDAKAQ